MAYRDLILADDPSLYWPLDSTYGATDQSGNSRNGTGAGGVTIGGYSGSPITGETTSTDLGGYLTSTYAPYTNSTVRTFSGWAYADTLPGSCLFGGSSAYQALQVPADGSVIFYPSVGGSTASWAAGTITAGAWFHWALTFDESADLATLYINGASKGGVALAQAWGTSGNFWLGTYQSTQSWDGKMAHAAIFERALTASEIQSHYRAGSDIVGTSRYVHEAGRSQ